MDRLKAIGMLNGLVSYDENCSGEQCKAIAYAIQTLKRIDVEKIALCILQHRHDGSSPFSEAEHVVSYLEGK